MRYKHSYTRVRFVSVLRSSVPFRLENNLPRKFLVPPTQHRPLVGLSGLTKKMGEVQRVPRSTSSELDVRWLLRYFVSVVWLLALATEALDS